MSLVAAFKIQKECHDKCSEEEKQADEERLARKKEEERKKRIKNKIDWMALGYPDGKPPDEQRGQPRKLGDFAFNGAMYTDVAKSLFYWTEPDSGDPEKVHTYLKEEEGLFSQTMTRQEEKELLLRKWKATESKSGEQKKRKGTGRLNQAWSLTAKTFIVNGFLSHLERMKIDKNSCLALQQISAHLKKLKRDDYIQFNNQTQAHLLYWFKLY